MTDKTITIEITGEAMVIDAAMEAFVKQNGWTETIDGVANPQTQVQKARDVLRAFIMDTVAAYNIAAAIEAARTAASTQTEGALDLTTMTLSVA